MADFKRQLHEAEIDVALSEATVTMYNAQPQVSTDAWAWCMATVDVLFEGTSTKALVHTGSPVTIVSLKFLVSALGKQCHSTRAHMTAGLR